MNTFGGNATQMPVARFCPKCGAELPVGAFFCGKCGNRLPANADQQPEAPMNAVQQPAASAVQPPAYPASSAQQQAYPVNAAQQQAYSASAAQQPAYPANAVQQPAVVQGALSKPFNPASIASRVCAVIAIIAMFLPWLEVPAMQTLGRYASLLGVKLTSETSFPLYNMGDVAKALDSISRSHAYTGIHMAFLALWALALVVILICLVRSFVGRKSSGSLLVGGIFVAVVAILWFAAITFLDGEYSRQIAQSIGTKIQFFQIPPAVWVTFVAGLAAGILGIIGKVKKA